MHAKHTTTKNKDKIQLAKNLNNNFEMTTKWQPQ